MCTAGPCASAADSKVDGAFKAYAISLPEASELIDRLPQADPVLLHEASAGCELAYRWPRWRGRATDCLSGA